MVQVEYAIKAVENGGTSIGIRCKDGVILAVEKIITSKLLKKGANKRISTVDRNFGVAFSGLIPDGRHFVARAREEASSWRSLYKSPIPTASLAERLGSYVQMYTLYQYVRPFGITAIVGGWDSEGELEVDAQVGSGPRTGGGGKVPGMKSGGPGLYMIEPSGLYWVGLVTLLQEVLVQLNSFGRDTTAQRLAKADKQRSLNLKSSIWLMAHYHWSRG